MKTKNEKNSVKHSSVVNALHRASNKTEIQTYFEKVLELKHSGKEFPVNFDEVWSLVYIRRDKAINALKENFIEGIDYQCLSHLGKSNVIKNQRFTKAGGDRKSISYSLSVQCLEYFIARKERSVFEVYRKVFHQAMGTSLPVHSFQGKSFYHYKTFLKDAGMSLTSGAVGSRRYRNPQEFYKNPNTKEWYISVVYAKTIELYNKLREQYKAAFQRKLAYCEKNQLQLFGRA